MLIQLNSLQSKCRNFGIGIRNTDRLPAVAGDCLRPCPAKFNSSANVSADIAVIGSVDFLNDLTKEYAILYIGARSSEVLPLTIQWLKTNGFPDGEVYLAQEQSERLKIVRDLSRRNNIVVGIGDRWDDNQLHLEIGCMSIIVKEYAGDWNSVKKYIFR